MSISWQGKVVLLTGASSGIGRSMAVILGRRGASIGLLARREDELEVVAAEVVKAGGKALVLPTDVTDAVAVVNAAAKLRHEFGPIDVLVANAGIGTAGYGRELNADETNQVIRVNLMGAVNSVAAVVQEMVARGSGQLVAISSLASYRGLPKSGAYCASKAGLSALFESLRLDLTGTGVDVTIIHPGFIKTPLTAGREAQMPYLMELDDATEKMVRGIEARRKSFAFPWQLVSLVRLGMIMPIRLYDFIAARNSFRE
jgi:short-subunit dehydrogenase